jgi:hypothetical protein
MHVTGGYWLPLRAAVKVMTYVFLPIGVLILAGTVWMAVDTRAWLARSVAAEGAVVEMIRVVDRESLSSSFAPLVRFRTADGKSIEFQSTAQSNPPAYYAGQTVTVLYDPAKPNSAAIEGLFPVWGATMILAAIGIMFTAFGVGGVVIGRRLPQAA